MEYKVFELTNKNGMKVKVTDFGANIMEIWVPDKDGNIKDIVMGFDSPEEYLAAANAVIANPEALTKTEAEDGDTVYYVESTNEFVVLSTDGYIRTYFLPDSGKRYFDRQ